MDSTVIANKFEIAMLAQTEQIITDRRKNASFASTLGSAVGPRKFLLSGYCGAGNVGADVRMGEIIRQVRHLFKPDQVGFAYTCRQTLDYGPFASIQRETAEADLDSFLTGYDGVILCEGSLFKSNFANAMAISFIGALGIAAAEGKLSVAYGAEAGQMDPEVALFASTHCRDSLILARSKASQNLITDGLGLRAELGSDTAWTFEPAPPERARDLLHNAGWDGKSKLICVSPINPFWWPVRPDLKKAAALEATGAFKDIHLRSIFFHHDSDEARGSYNHYLKAIAEALGIFCRETGAFPVLVGMEELDRPACHDLQSILDEPAPIFMSGDYSTYDIVSILRQAFVLVSSRYHALVTAMPGFVPGIGITMDERIRNLLVESGNEECVLEAGDPDLSDSLIAALRHVNRNRSNYAAGLPSFVGEQLRRMSRMGELLCLEITSRFPEVEPLVGRGAEGFLPPLDPQLLALLRGGVA